jgi:hypothetical protein
MRRIAILTLACVLVLSFTTSALAGGKWKPPKYCPPPCPNCDPCIYKSSKLQIPAGVWSETLVESIPGQTGNKLFAQGGCDWKFEGATLEEVADITGTVGLGEFGVPQRCFVTRYEGGTFTFNKFSYCCGKPLVAHNVTAFVYTCKGPDDGSGVFGLFSTFTVKFSGSFGEDQADGDSTDLIDEVAFEAIGHFAGIPAIVPKNSSLITSGCLDSVELIIKGDIQGFCHPPTVSP